MTSGYFFSISVDTSSASSITQHLGWSKNGHKIAKTLVVPMTVTTIYHYTYTPAYSPENTPNKLDISHSSHTSIKQAILAQASGLTISGQHTGTFLIGKSMVL